MAAKTLNYSNKYKHITSQFTGKSGVGFIEVSSHPTTAKLQTSSSYPLFSSDFKRCIENPSQVGSAFYHLIFEIVLLH